MHPARRPSAHTPPPPPASTMLPYRQTLVGPVYSGCTHCYPPCNGTVRKHSIEWARDYGCPDLDGLAPGERCNFQNITGITRPTTNSNDEEFILWVTANRDQVRDGLAP